MNKDFIPPEESHTLKVLGFYEMQIAIHIHTRFPLYQQVFRWFRDVHNIHGEINILKGSNLYHRVKGKEKVYSHWIYDLNDKLWSIEGIESPKEFYSYEEAQLDCVREMIKLLKVIKNKK